MHPVKTFQIGEKMLNRWKAPPIAKQPPAQLFLNWDICSFEAFTALCNTTAFTV